MLKIAERVSDAGVFFATLLGEPLYTLNLPAILSALGGCQLQVFCNGRDEELALLAGHPRLSCQIVLDVTANLSDSGQLHEKVLVAALDRLRKSGYEPVLALTPLRSNLGLIPDVLGFCRQNEVHRLKLPNAHIGDSFHQYSSEDLPRWEDLNDFKRLWETSAPGTEDLPKLEIHDLFLWEIMTPDKHQNRSEYGGCQAANSLAHVDIHGDVHPCAAWPYPLGNILELSLEDIWAGSERHLVCKKIAETPAGCSGCSDLDMCYGGCRGLAINLNSNAGERDLMCPGAR